MSDARRPSPAGGLGSSRPGPDERLAARRLGRELRDALDALTEPQRLAVFLIDVQDYTYDEAARVLGMPPGTVASRVARGRASLRARLQHLARQRGWGR
jgi:RNA polymerase sigma-70 factor (ECF subfamily)